MSAQPDLFDAPPVKSGKSPVTASAPIAVAPEPPILDALTLDDALAALGEIDAFLSRALPQVNEAHAARQQLLAVISDRMTAQGARKYVGAHHACRYEMRKSGSAAIPLPAGLRAELLATAKIPAADIDDALPMIVPPPTYKADLRKVRKLADYGETVADIIDRHIIEPRRIDHLIVEPLMLDVNPSPEALS